MQNRLDFKLAAICTSLCLPGTVADCALAQDAGQAAQTEEGAQDVSEITITARRGGSTVKIDRTVYDIVTRKDAASLSTVEVLKRLPGVFVDP